MTLPNVKCSVSNCRHWSNQNCNASGIEVNLDGGTKEAKNSQNTQCHTFEGK